MAKKKEKKEGTQARHQIHLRNEMTLGKCLGVAGMENKWWEDKRKLSENMFIFAARQLLK